MPISLELDDREELVALLLGDGRFSNQSSIDNELQQADLGRFIGSYELSNRGKDLIRNLISTLQESDYLENYSPERGYTGLGALLRYLLISDPQRIRPENFAFLINLLLDYGLINLGAVGTYDYATQLISDHLVPENIAPIEPSANVFIGHAQQDLYFAYKLAIWLAKLGATSWLDYKDETIPNTIEWKRELQAGAEVCDLMIIVVSPHSMQSLGLLQGYWRKFLDSDRRNFAIVYRKHPLHFELAGWPQIEFGRKEHSHSQMNPFKQIAQQLQAAVHERVATVSDMERRLQNFVDRTTICRTFEATLDVQTSESISIEGRSGLGKTLLVSRLRQICRERKVASTLINFDNPGAENHQTIILQAMMDLTGAEFPNSKPLFTGIGSLVPTTEEVVALPQPVATLVTAAPITAARIGDTLRHTETGKAEAYNNRLQRETQAFLDDLALFGAQHRMVFFFDNYPKAPETTRKWIEDNLILKLRTPQLKNIVLVFTGDIGRTPGSDALVLRNFTENDVRDYCERRGLDLAVVSPREIFEASRNGDPLLVATTVDLLVSGL